MIEKYMLVILTAIIITMLIILAEGNPFIVVIGISLVILTTLAEPANTQSDQIQYNQQQTEDHGNNSVLYNCICNIQEPVQNW